VLILIPARRNSKGLKFKNRRLFDFTVSEIPEEYLKKTYVSTDDEEIKARALKICNVHDRTTAVSNDAASTLSLVKQFKRDFSLTRDEIVVMLYLTYPERAFNEVLDAVRFFEENNLKSLLCKKETKVSPYLQMYELQNGKGKQIIEHDLYRRQDYPKTFEISHYISIFKVSEIKNLNNNLYNRDTHFYEIEEKIDVDSKEDLERFENDKN
jgi:CMP-N-acetylneuraminic acid synthetase